MPAGSKEAGSKGVAVNPKPNPRPLNRINMLKGIYSCVYTSMICGCIYVYIVMYVCILYIHIYIYLQPCS